MPKFAVYRDGNTKKFMAYFLTRQLAEQNARFRNASGTAHYFVREIS